MQSLRPLRTARALRPLTSHAPRLALATRTPHAPFSTTRASRDLEAPFNLPKWLTKNAHLLQPPINNYCITHTPSTLMIVGGPNARTDYHINSTPEFFYQHRGPLLLKTRDPQTHTPRDIAIHEGDMYLLPPGVPHNPVRFKDTVGVVVEQPRAEGAVDRLRWYCGGCGDVVAERGFVCVDLGRQIKEAVEGFEGDGEGRRCRRCGEVCEVRPRDVESMRPVARVEE